MKISSAVYEAGMPQTSDSCLVLSLLSHDDLSIRMSFMTLLFSQCLFWQGGQIQIIVLSILLRRRGEDYYRTVQQCLLIDQEEGSDFRISKLKDMPELELKPWQTWKIIFCTEYKYSIKFSQIQLDSKVLYTN